MLLKSPPLDNFPALLVLSKADCRCFQSTGSHCSHVITVTCQVRTFLNDHHQVKVIITSSDHHHHHQDCLTTCKPPCRSVLTVVHPQKLVSTGILPVCENTTFRPFKRNTLAVQEASRRRKWLSQVCDLKKFKLLRGSIPWVQVVLKSDCF